MKLETTGDGQITLKEVDKPIRFVDKNGVEFFIRESEDGEFEFKYAGKTYIAKEAKILPAGPQSPGS